MGRPRIDRQGYFRDNYRLASWVTRPLRSLHGGSLPGRTASPTGRTAMKTILWGLAGTAGMALLIGCGGSGGTLATTTTTTGSTGATGTTSTNGGTTGTTPITFPAAGTYTGTYTSSVFAQGGPSTTGPSGASTLVIASDGTFNLSLGSATVVGSLSSTGTTSASFTGTFTSGSTTNAVQGTITQSATRTIARFSNYTDSSQANGTLYSASLS